MTAPDLPVITPPGVLHDRHGPHDPSRSIPDRAPGSVRRTSTVDSFRPDGALGRVEVLAIARDLVTMTHACEEVGRDRLTAEIDFLGGRTVTALASQPAEPRLGALVGSSAASGFRGHVEEHLPDQVAAASRLHLLLDDLPTATLVAGYSLGAAARRDDAVRDVLVGRVRTYPAADLCAGWQTGGTIMVGLQSTGMAPVVTGPPAPALDGDPLGWHDRPPLLPHAMRRARLLDVTAHDDNAEVYSLLRDSHLDEEGAETVVHEYVVRATVADGLVTACSAEVKVLPWVECPAAAASAGRLVGRPLAGLRPEVRAEFVGVSTCTHLNDQLRSLADVPGLLAELGRR